MGHITSSMKLSVDVLVYEIMRDGHRRMTGASLCSMDWEAGADSVGHDLGYGWILHLPASITNGDGRGRLEKERRLG